jgi:uncharacterized protein YqjF (DUF2071 family)
MLSLLKNHPFAVEAFFESSLVFTFAVPKHEIQKLIPECLQLDTFRGKWAFIAVAMVQTKDLRPSNFPKVLGSNFFLIGYRVFVRFKTPLGKTMRGLYILKSETDKRKMKFWGNIFTHYNYTITDVTKTIKGGMIAICSHQSGLQITVEASHDENISLPLGSPFTNWTEARKFAGPLPFTFTYNSARKEVLIIEGVRENWRPMPVKVLEYGFSFIDNLKLDNVQLASAFIIRNIPYHWKKGRIVKWKQKEESSRAS